MLASETGRVAVVNLLLERTADIEAQTSDSYTALHIAAVNGQAEIAQLLADQGANVHAVNEQNQTALMIGASEGHADVVKVLVLFKINPDTMTDVKAALMDTDMTQLCRYCGVVPRLQALRRYSKAKDIDLILNLLRDYTLQL